MAKYHFMQLCEYTSKSVHCIFQSGGAHQMLVFGRAINEAQRFSLGWRCVSYYTAPPETRPAIKGHPDEESAVTC
ncbi:hypothetical protein Vspart_01185 [Vibrio spartinae]|uniref:Uncharacterized protein n=1 Tax=Vibrio spartinae TaxID=1918945 RepID=A0A1N6M6X5_9VIBR|nr:hypothetical protein Vspart_01185 [Vibrio spartinae]SIO95202.1 hypothetical protein VSP9026_02943 [Vibrio spartinae]